MLRIFTLLAHVIFLCWMIGAMNDSVPYGYTLILFLFTVSGTLLAQSICDELRDARGSTL